MAFLIMPGRKRVKKVKTAGSQEVLRRLEEYLKNGVDEPVKILCNFWKDQQSAITYKELREAVKSGSLTQSTWREWTQDYSNLVKNQLNSLWTNALTAGATGGQPLLDGVSFEFNTQKTGVLRWISERGAEFVTSSTQTQKDAISALLTQKMREKYTVDELSRMIRPCIGLTEGDAKATARLYDSVVRTLKSEHPRMSATSIRQKALDTATKYAEGKQRARALTIAQTESAFAYNRGADEGIRQAQEQGYIGAVKKRWSTSGDDAVCDTCAALEGTELGIDGEFNFGGRLLFAEQHMLPPAHPRCACAVEYIEISKPSIIPEDKVSITQEDSWHTYSEKEIKSMATQTEAAVSRHTTIASKWSGNIVINDEAGRQMKLWNCDIQTTSETAPQAILHEQLHARSASYYDWSVYTANQYVEETSVQYFAQEISKKEGIEIIGTDYDDRIDALRSIRSKFFESMSDYDFAKTLFEKPLPERFSWLEDALYDIIGKNTEATIADYQELSEWLNLIYF